MKTPLPFIIVTLLLALFCRIGVSARAFSTQRSPSQIQPAPRPSHIEVSVNDFGDWVGIAFGFVWLKTSGDVEKIDPATNRVVASIPVASCRGFAAGFGRLWTLDCGAGKLLAIDPMQGKVSASTALQLDDASEGSIAAGDGAIWVITQTGGQALNTLTRVDPNTLKIAASIPISPGSNGIADQSGFIWVTNTDNGTVTEVDPLTDKIIRIIPVRSEPRFIAGDRYGVWVANQGDGTVSHIDPASGTVVATIDLGHPGGGGDIKADDAGVWVAAFGTPITRIDPSTDQILRSYSFSAGDALNVGFGSVWVPYMGSSGAKLLRIAEDQL
jgi:YVTN family beta-propeller protein